VGTANSINLGISVSCPGKRLGATVLRAMILKWPTLSGAIEMVIRYIPLPASTVRIIIIPDVFIVGRGRVYTGSQARGSYCCFKERGFLWIITL